MLFSVLVAVVTSQQPITPVFRPADSVAVLMARRTGVAADTANSFQTALINDLTAAGFTNVFSLSDTARRLKAADISDTLACGGRPTCLVSAGARIEASLLVLVSGSRVETEQVWVLEVFETKTERPIFRADWVEQAAAPNGAKRKEFAAECAKYLLPTTLAATPTDAPKDQPTVSLATSLKKTATASTPSLRSWSWVPISVGAALGLAAGALFLGAFTDAQTLAVGDLTPQAINTTALRGQALQTSGIVAASAAVTAGLVGLAMYLFGAPTASAVSMNASGSLGWVTP